MSEEVIATMVLLAICLACLGGIWVVAKEQTRAREAFMAECQKDHKEYECTALWRSGESHTQVVPIYIPQR